MSRFRILRGTLRVRFATIALGIITVSSGGFYGTSAVMAAGTPSDVTYAHDPLGRLTGVIDPATGVAQYVYDAVGNATAIKRFALATLSLIEFSPATAAPGTQDTLYGSGFNTTASSNTVTFNGLAASVVSATQTKLVVTVPTGVTTGPIAVNNGTANVTSSRAFVATPPPPGVVSLSASVASPGASVTITGSGFDTTLTGNQVLVNGTRAVVTAASSTSISFIVPLPASSGPVTVIDPNGVATGPDLYVVPAPYQATDIGFRARISLGTAATATISTAGQQAMLIFTGTKGHSISVVGGSSATLNGTGTIYGPNGSVVATTNIGQNSFLDETALSETGTYTLFITPNAPGTGSVAVTVYDVPADAAGTATFGTTPGPTPAGSVRTPLST
jgi:YD repeat-containing protein